MSLLLLYNTSAAASTLNAAADWEIDGELAVDGTINTLFAAAADWEIDGELAVAGVVGTLLLA